MTQAIAAIAPPTLVPAVHAATPTVFVDAVPEPALQVLRFTASLPMDARRAVLAIDPASSLSVDSLRGTPITLATPHALSDGETRWDVLLSGQAQSDARLRAARTDDRTLALNDRLAGLLGDPADTLGLDPANADTLGDWFRRLAARCDAEPVVACDPAELWRTINAKPGVSSTLAGLLASALDAAGLALHQSLMLERDRVRRTLCITPARVGRRVALPWPDNTGRGGMVLKADRDAEQTPPRRWVALGGRPAVEDTFALVPGWDPALAGQPDADYARLTSSDYSRYGSVFRAWVLNEDGAFTAEPFDQGPPFDAGALFDAPASIDGPLRLGGCLAADASGLSIAPVVESSTDSGASWSAYPGRAEVMQDRAGVLLADDTLPSAVLAAAKAGTLRLRVTASLTAPDRIERQRWDGNPFAGVGPTRTVRLGDRYRWRRVMPSSIHADAIDTGQLSADVADDRAALGESLRELINRSPGASVSATVQLAGAWTALRVGDTVADPVEPGRSIDATPTAFDPRAARVHQIQIDFGVANNTPRTRLRFD
jgi:hypothetical protein